MNQAFIQKTEGNKLNIRDVAFLAVQMIQRLKTLHENNFLHRDLKPANFMLGRKSEDAHKVYLIDFGLAKLFMKNGKHIKSRDDVNSVVGTLRYSSIDGNQGDDDKEAEAPTPVQVTASADMIMQSIGHVPIVSSHQHNYQHNLGQAFYIPPIVSCFTLFAAAWVRTIVYRCKTLLLLFDSCL